jgi:hypothetical protein
MCRAGHCLGLQVEEASQDPSGSDPNLSGRLDSSSNFYTSIMPQRPQQVQHCRVVNSGSRVCACRTVSASAVVLCLCFIMSDCGFRMMPACVVGPGCEPPLRGGPIHISTTAAAAAVEVAKRSSQNLPQAMSSWLGVHRQHHHHHVTNQAIASMPSTPWCAPSTCYQSLLAAASRWERLHHHHHRMACSL